jgi:hypothetical protein
VETNIKVVEKDLPGIGKVKLKFRELTFGEFAEIYDKYYKLDPVTGQLKSHGGKFQMMIEIYEKTFVGSEPDHPEFKNVRKLTNIALARALVEASIEANPLA